MKIKDIREAIWPLLDPEPKSEKERKPVNISSEQIDLADEDLTVCYDLALKYYEDENNRKSSVESKSTIFVSSIGFTTAILIAMTKDLVLSNKTESPFTTYTFIFLLVLIVVYMARAVWFAVMVLERKGYHTLSYADFVKNGKPDNYRSDLASKLINMTISNQKIINSKVDNMVLAHKYFKRAIILIVVYSITLAITFPVMTYISRAGNDDTVIKILSCTNTGTWLLSALLAISAVNLFLLRRKR